MKDRLVYSGWVGNRFSSESDLVILRQPFVNMSAAIEDLRRSGNFELMYEIEPSDPGEMLPDEIGIKWLFRCLKTNRLLLIRVRQEYFKGQIDRYTALVRNIEDFRVLAQSPKRQVELVGLVELEKVEHLIDAELY